MHHHHHVPNPNHKHGGGKSTSSSSSTTTHTGTTGIRDLLHRAKAKFVEEAVKDLSTALAAFPDLHPDLAFHLFPDNITRWCVSLTGTLPISYKGSIYHIPVALYLLDNHPYTGPYCYVAPTSQMRIRSSPQVDEKGRLYLPYLTEWRYPSYDTAGLLQVMVITFQEKCPVFSVGSGGEGGGGGSSTTAMPAPNAQQPQQALGSQLPPYPTVATHMPTPYGAPAGGGGGGFGSGAGYPMPQQPPYPTMPAAGGGGAYQPNVGVPPPIPPLPHSHGGSGRYHHHSGNGGDRSHHGSRTSLNSRQQMLDDGAGVTPYPMGGGGGKEGSTIQSNHIRASLLSAVEDKIKLVLTDKIGTPFAELQSIDANLQELRANQQKLRETSELMQNEQRQLDSIIAEYKEKKAEFERALEACSASANNGHNPSVEEAIDAATPLHRQIVRHYMQDCAIDDTIYHLGQALKRGTVNLQVYLKYVRQLSRQQFLHRATMQKCRQRAQLPI